MDWISFWHCYCFLDERDQKIVLTDFQIAKAHLITFLNINQVTME